MIVYRSDGLKLSEEQSAEYRAQRHGNGTIGEAHDAGEATFLEGAWTSGEMLITTHGTLPLSSLRIETAALPGEGDVSARYTFSAFVGDVLVKHSEALTLIGKETNMAQAAGRMN